MFPFSGLLNVVNQSLIDLPANISIFDFGIWPGTVTAGFEVERGGGLEYFDSGGVFQSFANFWMASTGRTSTIGDAYEVMLSGTGDTPDGPALDVWHTINTLRAWSLSSAAKFVNEDFNGTLQIREIANTANIVSANVFLTIEQEL